MKLSIWALIKGQFAKLPPVAKADLTGKTVIVLGANTGLGFEATKHFARMNPGRLILACRSQSKGQAALERMLKAATGFKNAELWIIDLADFASVKSFADKFEQDGGRLDILVENAGVAPTAYEASKDGMETAFQVNCMSTPLLAFLLLPHMMRTAQQYSTVPRLAVVASEVHHFTTIPKDVSDGGDMLATFGSAAYCTPKVMRSRYLLTKLLNVFFVRALNARLAPAAPLIVTAINPGFCYSELNRPLSGVQALIMRLMHRIFAFTAEEGARQLVFGAVGLPESLDKLRGQYINQSRTEEPSDFVISAEGQKAQDRIWDELVETLGKVDPRVLTTVDKYLSPTAAA
ncbi:hypothetical protein B0H17DRAFT_1091568 [Mycena rosella]|uniref:NAD(P)-binding protein n=1 Tax=Mycena rosella TaxID=1033263 RepID=A0AAD7CVT3_MYCRO|nr:hypothetical protein B0H17DRAFT_1091568 [Mycena rosella]